MCVGITWERADGFARARLPVPGPHHGPVQGGLRRAARGPDVGERRGALRLEGKTGLVQWLQLFFLLFFCDCPTKKCLSPKRVPLFSRATEQLRKWV